jgi:hypothetical protein
MRAQRPDRPVLERDLESFDEPLLIDHSASASREAPRASGIDPFAEFIEAEPEEAATLPTLDDLLASMPAPAAPTPMTFPSTSLAAAEAPSAPMIFEPSPEPAIERPAASIAQAAAPVESNSGRSIIADAFSALLAVEQGEPGAAPLRLGGNGSAPVVTDAMVDDVARRVIEKLALGSSDQMGAVVRQIVSEIAERLVREEIDRIRNKQ